MDNKIVRATDVMKQLDRIIDNVKAAGGVREEQLTMIRAVTQNALDLAPEAGAKESAAEIFRNLGYKEVELDSAYSIYQNADGVAIEIAVPAESIVKFRRDPWRPGALPFTAGEILACAQLIKEMEAEKDG